MSVPAITFARDDLTSPQTRALIAEHLAAMFETSPPESVHALGIEALQAPEIEFWVARVDGVLAGCGALKRLDPARAELKSMRVTEPFRGRGIGAAILEHLTERARAGGVTSLWLETGSGPAFAAASRLYLRAGFELCPPFGDYVEDPFSVFMTKRL